MEGSGREAKHRIFISAGSLVNRQLILVEGQARGWTSRRNGIVSFNRSTAISSCHSIPAFPAVLRLASHFLRRFDPSPCSPLLPLCHSLVASSIFSLSLRRVGLFLPRSLLNCVLPGARAQTTLSMAGIKRLLPFPPPSLATIPMRQSPSQPLILSGPTFSLLSL